MEDINTLVDVGNDPSIVERILAAPTGVGTKTVEQVILTHHHVDHTGVLPRIRYVFDPVVYAQSRFIEPDFILEDGQHFKCGDRAFEVIHTPGHSADSICLYCQTDGVLFVGDTPVIIRATDAPYDARFVHALERLCRKDVRAIYFGHGDSITVGANIVLNESLENIRRANRIGEPRASATRARNELAGSQTYESSKISQV
ncbi:MAG: MBL fold metallo-hydrolase [Chloroflexi bacterium]|nr:MBL fold metallo-hydrolase [Chloroflexota bacterium]